METLRSMFVPVLFLSVWFAGAAATFSQLAEMGGTLAAADVRERAHQIEIERRTAERMAIREALADTSSLIERSPMAARGF